MRVRRLTPSDEGAYRSILARTSREDRYFRFFIALDDVAAADVRHAVEDRPDSLGFLAEENGRSLGIAHGELQGNDSAELAVLVARDARRRGVATALLQATIADLRRLGVERIIAYSLRDNYAFSNLGRSLGLRVEEAKGSEQLWTLAPRDRSIKAA